MTAPGPQPWKPKSRKEWWTKGPGIIVLIVAVVGTLAVLAAVLGEVESKNATDDIRVQVTKCELGEIAGTVGLSVTNNGTKTRTVRIGLEYRDGSGRRVDTDTATVRDVSPGDTVVHDEPTLLNAAVTGQGACIVTSVR
jgi:hypothetical protein